MKVWQGNVTSLSAWVIYSTVMLTHSKIVLKVADSFRTIQRAVFVLKARQHYLLDVCTEESVE